MDQKPFVVGGSSARRPTFKRSPFKSGGFKSGSPKPGGFHRAGGTSKPGGYQGSRTGGYQGNKTTGYQGNRGGSRGGKRGGGMGDFIDPSKFINKAVITEEVVNFIPEHQFTDFQIDEELKKAVVAKGYVLPTPIQDKAIPHVLRGEDVVGIANTGTGKTAAFLIPLIHKVRTVPNTQVLIVVPTRELAVQIESELRGFTKLMKIFSVVCVGGASIGPQIMALRRTNQFVIGTPGRLKDLIERGKIRLASYNTIVLDEADRMLDMGFVHDMRYVMQGMPKDRHTLFFSATVSKEIDVLINEFLREPVRIRVTTGDTSKNVDQDVVHVAPGKDKFDILHELLNQKEFSKVLVFGRTKHGVEKLSKSLTQRGFKADSIHGNKSQSQRQRSLGLFKDGKVQILVATDVAARGLDINDVSHVINYELPMTYDDYVHRIGRTGRAGKKGKALTFIDQKSR
jgi:ATP-dependent RNA helicase RhlE